MTERKTQRRPRRSTNAASSIPRDIAQWFAGERPANAGALWPVKAKGPPHCALLPEYWADWKAEHPDAMPPAGYEWIADPDSPRQPPQWQIDAAHQMLRRPRR